MNENDELRPPEPTEPPTPPLPPSEPAPSRPAASEGAPQAKAPALAVILSFFLTGLGHLYAEAYERGAMLFASLILVIFATARGALPVPLGVLICIFLWFFGMFDSYREAQLLNLGGEQPRPAPSDSGRGRLAFGVFLAVVGALMLVENLDLFDLDWLLDWWPALVVVVGIYLIAAAVRERMERGGAPPRGD